MFGTISLQEELLNKELNSNKIKKKKSLYMNIQNCENKCNLNGICINKICYCQQGKNKIFSFVYLKQAIIIISENLIA